MVKRRGLQRCITARRRAWQLMHPHKAYGVRLSRSGLSRPTPWRHPGVHGWRLLLLLGLVGVVVLWGHGYAEHIAALHWMMGYTSAEGVGCCSERDCHPWPVAVLQLTGDQAMVRIGDTVVQLPAKSVHATQDGQTYWCCKTNLDGHCPPEPSRATTRCVFYATGM